MQKHCQTGYTLLSEIDFPLIKISQIIALEHHERFDGKGYPKGLKNNEISLEGRIVAIADVFDALTSSRPYKESWPYSKAFNLLKEEKDKHFDAELVDLFLENKNEIIKIMEDYKG